MGTGQAAGTCLYAVVSDLRSPDVLGQLTGVRDGQVYTIADHDLFAVVSDLPSREELRPERRNLSAYQRVMGKVLESSRVALPVAFGTIAESPESVRGLLERYHDDLATQLRKVEGKQQMNVRLSYSGPGSIFDYLVSTDPDLKAARDELMDTGATATREQKIELGQSTDAALSALREEYSDLLAESVGECCSDVTSNPPRTEQDAVRLVCLVSKEQQQELERAITEAASQFPEAFALELTGPFLPYDFVDLHLQA